MDIGFLDMWDILKNKIHNVQKLSDTIDVSKLIEEMEDMEFDKFVNDKRCILNIKKEISELNDIRRSYLELCDGSIKNLSKDKYGKLQFVEGKLAILDIIK